MNKDHGFPQSTFIASESRSDYSLQFEQRSQRPLSMSELMFRLGAAHEVFAQAKAAVTAR